MWYTPRRLTELAMKHSIVTILVVAVCLTGAHAAAHHSFAATYLEDKRVTIEGEIVQFLFRNPHSFVHVSAKDTSGTVQRWAVEWGGGGQLATMGVNRDTLRPGDHVIVTGDASRTPDDFRLRMRSIERPKDGWRWSGEVD